MYAFCQDMPGVTLEQQSRVEAMIGPESLGECLAHVVGAYDGGVRMIDVWTSEEAYRSFQTEVLWPVLDRLTPQLGTQAPPPFTVHEVTGRGRGSVMAQSV